MQKRVINPAASSFAAQQRRFDGFVEEFNWQRSHEALGRLTPGRVHEVSPRPYRAKLPAIEYDRGVTVRQVTTVSLSKRLIYLSQVLEEPIGLVACDNDCWEIRYSFHLLGFLNDVPIRLPMPDSGINWRERACPGLDPGVGVRGIPA